MPRLRTWVTGWAVLGVAVAAFWLAIGLAGRPYDTYVLWVFPGAFVTMVFELGRQTAADVALVATIATVSNMLLYALAGLVLWLVGRGI